MSDESTHDDAASADPDAPDPGRLDLKVARVREARDHPNADRLLLLDIDLGGGDERQIVAGIVSHYELDELEGKHIVVVANLQPAEIRGQKSEGMLLAAETDDALGLLLAPEAEPGQRLRPARGGEPADEITFDEFNEHDLRSGPLGVRVDGEPLSGARFVMDRGVFGPLK